jgi:hypothetical protein
MTTGGVLRPELQLEVHRTLKLHNNDVQDKFGGESSDESISPRSPVGVSVNYETVKSVILN